MQGKVAKAISRGNCFRRMRWNFLCAPEVQTKRHSPNAPEIQANRRAPAENAEALYTSTPSGLSPGDSPYFDLIRVRFAHPPAGFPKECLCPLLRGRPVGHPLCSDCGQSKRIRWAISQRPYRRHNRVPYAGEGGESNFRGKLLSPDEVELSPCSGGTGEPAFPRAPEIQTNRRAPAENTEAQAPVW